jgi:hypothetical protein
MNNDLISRSALLEKFDWLNRACANDGANKVAAALVKLVENATSVDAEVVRHGRWEHGMQCPYCKQIDLTKPNYCPNCGAKMDGEHDDIQRV